MKVLNAYAGIGGNRKLWEDVEVTAVESNEDVAAIYSDFYPQDTVVIGDAREYILNHHKEFDFIWSSKPCNSHSDLRRMGVDRGSYEPIYPDFGLYEEIILLKHFYKGKWVVENVKPYYRPLIEPTASLDRHIFWANFRITPSRFQRFGRNRIKTGHVKELQELKGVDISEYKVRGRRRDAILRSYMNPNIGLHLLNCARNEQQSTIKQWDRGGE